VNVPPGAYITGIEFGFTRRPFAPTKRASEVDKTDIYTSVVSLAFYDEEKNITELVGENKADPSDLWPITYLVETHGNTTDKVDSIFFAFFISHIFFFSSGD